MVDEIVYAELDFSKPNKSEGYQQLIHLMTNSLDEMHQKVIGVITKDKKLLSFSEIEVKFLEDFSEDSDLLKKYMEIKAAIPSWVFTGKSNRSKAAFCCLVIALKDHGLELDKTEIIDFFSQVKIKIKENYSTKDDSVIKGFIESLGKSLEKESDFVDVNTEKFRQTVEEAKRLSYERKAEELSGKYSKILSSIGYGIPGDPVQPNTEQEIKTNDDIQSRFISTNLDKFKNPEDLPENSPTKTLFKKAVNHIFQKMNERGIKLSEWSALEIEILGASMRRAVSSVMPWHLGKENEMLYFENQLEVAFKKDGLIDSLKLYHGEQPSYPGEPRTPSKTAQAERAAHLKNLFPGGLTILPTRGLPQALPQAPPRPTAPKPQETPKTLPVDEPPPPRPTARKPNL